MERVHVEPMMTLRFDMQAPEFGAPIDELSSSAIEMCAWAEDRGALLAVLSEHHGTANRHLPSPLMLASASFCPGTRSPIRAWDELGRHLLHDAMTAASYRQRGGDRREHQHRSHG